MPLRKPPDAAPAQQAPAVAESEISLSRRIRYLIRMPNPSSPIKRGVFPGQFDPITNGHLDVIKRGVKLFDELIVAVGINPDKQGLFTLDERQEMIGELLKDIPQTRVMKYAGLTADFVREVKATAILRGIRDVSDLRYEFQLALANRAVGGIETIFIMTGDAYALTSSSLIRQVVSLGGDVDSLATVLPKMVIDRLKEKQRDGSRLLPLPETPEA
jgi:pantetheine-phosphate adenylyltransferase